MLQIILAAFLSSGLPVPSPVAFPVGRPLPRMSLLKPGTTRYVRYSVKDGHRSLMDLWTRTVAIEGGKLHMTQRWERPDASIPSNLQDSWFRRDFSPLTHSKQVTKEGVTTSKSWRFDKDAVVQTAGSIGGNTPATQIAPEAPYNFEYDMELLQTLPWRKGMVADVVFYDPGLQPPAHYKFVEAGERTLRGADGRPIDCWLVTADYNTGKIMSRFWIAKGSQLVVHEESEFDGVKYVKTLIGAEADGS